MASSSQRKRSTASNTLVFVLMFVVVIGGFATDSDSTSAPVIDTCSDGLDNDGDGLPDESDMECDPTSPSYDGDEDDPMV